MKTTQFQQHEVFCHITNKQLNIVVNLKKEFLFWHS